MSLANFDLNLLKVLDALLDECSTTRAGQRIGLSQPAVSAALSRLRHGLGDELLVRQGQGLQPTAFALSLRAPLRDVLDRANALVGQRGTWDPAEADDILRISGLDFFAEMLMPQLSETLFREAPQMRVQMLDLLPDASVDMLDRHNIDIALLPKFDVPSWIIREPLFYSPFAMIARKDHPNLSGAGIAPGSTVPLDLFCDLSHVLCSPDGNLRAMGDEALAKLGRARRVVMSMPYFSAVTAVVASSDVVALIPAQLAERVAPMRGLDIFQSPIEAPRPLLTMIYHRRDQGRPAHRWLRKKVAEILKPLNGDGPALPELD